MTEDELRCAVECFSLAWSADIRHSTSPAGEVEWRALLEAFASHNAEKAADAGLLWIKTADLGLLHAKAAVCDAIRGCVGTDEYLVDDVLCVDDGSGNAWMPRDDGERLRDVLSTLRRLENKP